MSFDYKRMLKFEHNIGAKEAKTRMIVGSVALLVSVFTAKIILLVAGLVLVAEGYAGWCPLYSGLGKSTCDIAPHAEETSVATEETATVSE
jgi:hypothetical protein